jgi:hypothetical protein
LEAAAKTGEVVEGESALEVWWQGGVPAVPASGEAALFAFLGSGGDV